MSEQTNKHAPLSGLRGQIDAVDHDILHLLSRRHALVAEVAACKRQNGIPIRDSAREREIIQDRRARSEPLGLQPDIVESVYRLLLWASRDRQAALRAQVPLDFDAKTVAIVGGKGAMGRCMSRLFADLGHRVMIADLDTGLRPEDAAHEADVVVVSVPIDVTVDVIRRIGPRVRAEALLMDVTSVKSEPTRAMMESSRASVAGTHPLFGPSVHSLQGQRVALIPGRGAEWQRWLRASLEARGLTVVETTAPAHDHAMAVVQVLTHFSTEVAGVAMARLGVSLEESLRFTSPVYLMEMLMTARHFAQAPDLYASIQMENPEADAVRRAFLDAAGELRDILTRRDHDTFAGTFRRVRYFFGTFTEGALEQSSFLIDRLVERM